MLELKRIPSSVFSKDKDDARDREVDAAIMALNYVRVKDEIGEIVRRTIETIHDNPRFVELIGMPHYAKIADDVIRGIYLKYYQK